MPGFLLIVLPVVYYYPIRALTLRERAGERG
jgi:hypothetical protein